jgi:ribosomal protein S18 acetylase RimI-like enzyme
METITYRFLASADFAAVHRTFLEAFSDYAVDMRVSEDQFAHRLVRDGVQLEMSVGAFDGSEMVGFCINGCGDWHGRYSAYDAGTGVVPGYRGKGIGKELFIFMFPLLKDFGFEQYLLEVISSNTAAVNLYRKLGFHETRTLDVFRKTKPSTKTIDATVAEMRVVESPDWRLYQSFWDGHPSWQNSIESIKRTSVGKIFLGAFVAGECVGYGVASSVMGTLIQLAIARDSRRRGIGSLVLAALQGNVTTDEPLKVNCVDHELSSSLSFYQARGYNLILNQLEMTKTL